jgi:hypothetical protein
MVAKVMIECDGNNCEEKAFFDFGYFGEGDLPTVFWSYDADNEFYYCPSCVKKMIARGELEE